MNAETAPTKVPPKTIINPLYTIVKLNKVAGWPYAGLSSRLLLELHVVIAFASRRWQQLKMVKVKSVMSVHAKRSGGMKNDSRNRSIPYPLVY